MSEPDLIEDAELFDVITLAGVTSPGNVVLSGHEDAVKWDVKGASGKKGASVTRKEAPPGEFTCTFFLLKDEARGINDYADWPDFRDLINSSTAGTTPKALDIYHPDLAELGIKSVLKASIGGRQYDGKGGCKIAVKFQVYAPPVDAGGSPSGSKSKPKKGNVPDPDQAALDELARLTKEYQNTPFG